MSRRRILHLLNIMGRLAGGGSLTFLLRDDFISDASAPLTSPRTAEPGPGTLTITDTENKLSISGGALTCAGGKASPAFGDPGIWGGVLARVAGRTLITKLTHSAANTFMQIGWDSDASGASADNDYYLTNTGVIAVYRANATTLSVGTYTAAEFTYAIVLRTTGTFFFVKGGSYTSWTLLWVRSSENTASLYPAINNHSAAWSSAYLRVLDLPAPFSTDYGLATQRLAGARSAGDTFTHTANCVIEWTVTTVPSAAGTVFRFRVQDSTNFWFAYIDSTGALSLYERVAGVDTLRASAAGVVSNGHRIVVVADGTTIRGYSNNVLRWTYSSASNFATETDGLLSALGTGGAVSEIISWPRALTGATAAILDAGVA